MSEINLQRGRQKATFRYPSQLTLSHAVGIRAQAVKTAFNLNRKGSVVS